MDSIFDPNGEKQFDYRNHFDNPNDGPPFVSRDDRTWLPPYTNTDWIQDGVKLINYHRGSYSGNPISGPTTDSVADIAQGFGRVTHALGDFYAHSNWVDNPDRGGCLFDSDNTLLGYVPIGLQMTEIWDEETVFGTVPVESLYTGTVSLAEVAPLTEKFYENDRTSHAYWNKDAPGRGTALSAAQLAQLGGRRTYAIDNDGDIYAKDDVKRERPLMTTITDTHLLARDLAIQKTVKEIERLYNAAPQRFRDIFAMTKDEKDAAKVLY